MQFYLATSFLFPRSLRLRLFSLCFIATHLPLVGYLVWGFAGGRIMLGEFLLLTAMTVVGTGVALIGIGALLTPIQRLASALEPATNKPGALPDVGDMIRSLYTGLDRAARETGDRIDRLHRAAHEDALTGIANRRGFLAHLAARPDDRKKGCVALIDIDYFKRVNDLRGHEEGDRVLAAFATRLSALVRRADLVARWGGEEFAIFFEDCIEDEASWTLARIAAQLRDRPIGEVHGRPISFSAGIARWNGADVGEAIARADAALYDAKQQGRDRISRAVTTPQNA